MNTNLKKISLIIILLTVTILEMKSQELETKIRITTNQGDIIIKLYDETPLHKANFIKLAEEGSFNNRIFHRVINDFMIQAGEYLGKELDRSDETIPAEIKFPQYYHKRGALAAARSGDDFNPEKASSKYQFYIVTGKTIAEDKLCAIEETRYERLKQSIFGRLQSENAETVKSFYREGNRTAITELRENMRIEAESEAMTGKEATLYTEDQKDIYKTIGGTPFLDNEYTVFGEVVEGMEIVDKIQNLPTDRDRPIEPVIIENVSVEKQPHTEQIKS